MKRTPFAALALALPLALGAASSCGNRAATQIVVAVSAETEPDALDRIELEVLDGDRTPRLWNSYRLPTGAHLPGTLTVYASEQADKDAPVRINVYAYLDGSRRFLRRATMPFVDGKTKLLRLPVRLSCVDFPEVCPDGSTCVAGECRSESVDAARLPDYDESFVIPRPGACFDPASCLQVLERDLTPMVPGKDQPCELPVGGLGLSPTFSFDRANLAMSWKASHGAAVVLDNEPDEGWALVERDGGRALALAPGLCRAVREGRATRLLLYSSSSCGPKSGLEPVCDGPRGVALVDGGAPDAPPDVAEAGPPLEAGPDGGDAQPQDAAVSSCASALPGDDCDPFIQTGCDGGACRIAGSAQVGFSRVCQGKAFGKAGQGQPCVQPESCQANMVCYKGACTAYCCDDTQCCPPGQSCPGACSIVQADQKGNEVRLCAVAVDGG